MKIPQLQLSRDLTKHLKQGHPWIFKDALLKPLLSPESHLAHLFYKNEFQGLGLYDAKINLVFRLLHRERKTFTQADFLERLSTASNLRKHLYRSNHNSFRLIHGEGDYMAGLVIDYYNEVLVVKTDGEAATKFWLTFDWSALPQISPFPVKIIYHKNKEITETKKIIWSASDLSAINLLDHPILENGIKFRVNIIDGAKTGFFIDQRDARDLVRQFSQDKTVLNLFSYTGGFSVAAGIGGAKKVISVDISQEAINSSRLQWEVNNLPPHHEAVCADAFDWIDKSISQKQKFDLIITDPPSFAPNEKAVETATNAYIDIFVKSLKLLKPNGLMGFSSCSSHISFTQMEYIIQQSLSKVRGQGKVLKVLGQPEDHPFYFAHHEGRYLKFYFIQVLIPSSSS